MKLYYTWQSCYAPENIVQSFIEVDRPAKGFPFDDEAILHRLWHRHNIERPYGNVMPSMSVGDIVTLYHQQGDDKRPYVRPYMPCLVGFMELEKSDVRTMKKAMCINRRAYLCCVSFQDSILEVRRLLKSEFGDRLKHVMVEEPCNTYKEPTNVKAVSP